jgi:hypothetical protein
LLPRLLAKDPAHRPDALSVARVLEGYRAMAPAAGAGATGQHGAGGVPGPASETAWGPPVPQPAGGLADAVTVAGITPDAGQRGRSARRGLSRGLNWKVAAAIAAVLVAAGGITAGLLLGGNGSGPGGGESATAPAVVTAADVTNCSQWRTTESDGYRQKFHFRSDGYVDYATEPSGENSYRSYDGSTDNSRWSLAGRTISISINNGYSRYQATVAGGRLVAGTGSNGQSSWTWTAVCP